MKLKYSHLSILCFFFVFLTGCALFKANAPFSGSEPGPCVISSRYIYKRSVGFGYKMRLCVGKVRASDKQGHQWAEYWNEDRQKWCLWDGAQWTVGKSWYTADETGYITNRCDDKGWVG